jgi:hypothetical protein
VALGNKNFGDPLLSIRHWEKLKVKVKVKFAVEQATKSQRGRRSIALLFP